MIPSPATHSLCTLYLHTVQSSGTFSFHQHHSWCTDFHISPGITDVMGTSLTSTYHLSQRGNLNLSYITIIIYRWQWLTASCQQQCLLESQTIKLYSSTFKNNNFEWFLCLDIQKINFRSKQKFYTRIIVTKTFCTWSM